MRQSLPRVLLLLQVEFVEVVQLVEDRLGLRNLAANVNSSQPWVTRSYSVADVLIYLQDWLEVQN